MDVVIAVAAVAILGTVVLLAMGRGGELAPAHPDYPPPLLPGDRRLVGLDAALLRLPRGLWGYQVDTTDDALRMFAEALSERDLQVAQLEQQVAELHRRASPGAWPAPPAALPNPLPPAAEPEAPPWARGAAQLPTRFDTEPSPEPASDTDADRAEPPVDGTAAEPTAAEVEGPWWTRETRADVGQTRQQWQEPAAGDWQEIARTRRDHTEPPDAAPHERAPQHANPWDDTPQDSAPQDDVPRESAPQDDVPQDDAPQDNAAQAAPHGTIPYAAPHGAAPYAAPHDAEPRDDVPSGDASHGDASPGVGPGSDAPDDGVARDGDAQDVPAHEDTHLDTSELSGKADEKPEDPER